MLKGKRGEKEIQIVFGLLVLLIITVVVLGLFFKTIQQSQEPIKGQLSDAKKKQVWESAMLGCKQKCLDSSNRDAAIEFCKSSEAIDINGNSITNELGQYGKWDFCEDTVPCFVLLDSDPECSYKGAACRELLVKYRPEVYTSKFYSADGKGSCRLLDASKTTSNWIVAFGFNRPAS
ncbi:hypothetical protein HYY74_03160 [Candidatus Woesearchaeota archaeon]|nr:hypothetical protein [Candidatus Woesearchaeota archaeon]